MIYDTIYTEPLGSGALAFVPVAASTSLDVDIMIAPGTPPRFQNGHVKSFFQPGDNVLLDLITCTIPYGFGQGGGIHTIGIEWENETGTRIIIPELADSEIAIPDLCSGVQYGNGGLFIKTPKADQGTKFRFVLTLTNLRLSMIGAPQILIDGEDVLLVTYWMGLRHTLPLGV